MRMFLLALLTVKAAQAATFTVDTTSDAALSTCTAAPLDCSLRGAISAANLTPASDQILFELPPSDPGFQAATQHWLFSIGNVALPVIEAPLLIDGYSQAGATANTNSPAQGGLNGVLKIEIRGTSGVANQQNGLDISLNFFSQGPSTFRGLVISRFNSQIQLSGSAAHRVEGCYLGTDISGLNAAVLGNNNLGNGVRVQGPGPYVIGGVLPAARNLISGMSNGVVFQTGSDGIRIQGNLIGTDANGTLPLGNVVDAISSSSPLTNALIGGTDPAARNVISASRFGALRMFAGSANDFNGTLIQGNFIGTDVTGTKPMGNGFNPGSPSQPVSTIAVSGTQCRLDIGGSAPGAANLIAYGGEVGILNDRCMGVSSTLNRFYGNRGIPFDNVFGGGAVGATPNDVGDIDEQGGNRLQNFPEITLPSDFLPVGGTSVSLQYRVDTVLASAAYPLTVNFYRGACGGGSEKLLQSDSYTAAQAQTLKSFVLQSPDGGNVLPLLASTVDALGNNSEFSAMLGDAIFRSDFEDVLAPLRAGKCL